MNFKIWDKKLKKIRNDILLSSDGKIFDKNNIELEEFELFESLNYYDINNKEFYFGDILEVEASSYKNCPYRQSDGKCELVLKEIAHFMPYKSEKNLIIFKRIEKEKIEGKNFIFATKDFLDGNPLIANRYLTSDSYEKFTNFKTLGNFHEIPEILKDILKLNDDEMDVFIDKLSKIIN